MGQQDTKESQVEPSSLDSTCSAPRPTDELLSLHMLIGLLNKGINKYLLNMVTVRVLSYRAFPALEFDCRRS